jgi:hypothetical protein
VFDDQYLIKESRTLPIASIVLNRGSRAVDQMQFWALLRRSTRIRFTKPPWLPQAAAILSAVNGPDRGEV